MTQVVRDEVGAIDCAGDARYIEHKELIDIFGFDNILDVSIALLETKETSAPVARVRLSVGSLAAAAFGCNSPDEGGIHV
jgi:hypothetical protein